ncbi:MAG: hypothetical protein J5927_06675 [Oscillospiraceae bacterium]|nr:hypothetical protein [Oscillospiraceae bacterium]
MKRKSWLLAVLALVLVLCGSVGSAAAYFTAYTDGQGGYVIRLGHETKIDEDYANGRKTVTIANKSGSAPVFIRARAFGGESYTLNYTPGANWSRTVSGLNNPEGFWYYLVPVEGGGVTQPLTIHVDDVLVGTNVKIGDTLNVAVIYESTPAVYNATGNPDLLTAWTTGPVTVIQEGGTGA